MAEHTPAPLNHEDAAYKHSKAKLEAAERDGYKQITAQDFFVDKSNMAAAGARVMSAGIYGRVHGIEYLGPRSGNSLIRRDNESDPAGD